jgi:tetratricopeptide (TPR) repeat protein
VDTGSSDPTPEIARAAGAHVINYEWKNDFAAARNFSLSLATKPWILVLDADERLDSLTGPLIQELTQQEPRAYFLNRRHYTASRNHIELTLLDETHPARSIGAVGYFSTADVRLFSNIQAIQFLGAVHESVEDSLPAAGLQTVRTDITIHHYGHLAPEQKLQQKYEYYLTLAEQRTIEAAQDWRSWYILSAELQGLGRHAEAIANLQRAIHLAPDQAVLWRQLGISLAHCGDNIDSLLALQKALAIDATCAITWNATGTVFLATQDLEQAETCFQTVLRSNPHDLNALAGLQKVHTLRS